MSQQQTVLRVQTNIPGVISGSTEYEFLDLYSSIPILMNKSFAELGDIGKRNSDYSVGVLLPGSKKNNAFFENYFNVDSVSLYFNPNARIPCWVLINDESYFTGYLRLNKVSVQDSKKEYDVTLFATPAELYGNIGNNLLKDLNFSDTDYHFNHEFSLQNVTEGFNYQNMSIDGEKPKTYFYPVVHNGYLYTGDTVNFSGGTILSRTNLYTSTSPIGSWSTLGAAYAAGVQQYRINSPTQGPYDNQLKPALNIWSLLQLIFKTYGYSIESEFFNTPWMKYLYMYGYFSSDATKFSWTIYTIQTLPQSGVEVFFVDIAGDVYCAISKLGTGVPCYCDSDVNITLNFDDGDGYYNSVNAVIPYGTSGLTINSGGSTFISGSSPDVPNGSTLKYLPKAVGDYVNFVDGDYVDFSLVIDQNIKQIDILSSIAKKFNLVLIPDPNNGYNIRIEPYDFYIGTGNVHNWSNLISYDKGFTVEPALNYIESQILLTDQEDNDEGNKLFKTSNNRIYGQNIYYGPTAFKSQEKKIDTIFGPEIIRKWDSDTFNNINLPLGINYVGSNQQGYTNGSAYVNWIYTGVKTKPKLFWWLGSFNPFLDLVGEVYDEHYYKTYNAYIQNTSGSTYSQFDRIPVISHTMPMGNPDNNKINNDNQCILFNSEYPTDEIGVQSFNTYTENDAFSTFYQGRISNLYNSNTRVLTGYFNLNYADIKNLEPKDLIKVNEQYFVVSKIEGFNYTNRELTKVELIQYNNRPKTYTDRYFQYFYCDNPSKIYKFKTDFTNPNLLDSNFGWSVYYDHQIGNISSSASGFTSSFKYLNGSSQTVYVPYYIYEVSQSDYDASGIPWDYDTLHNHIYNDETYGPFQYSMPSFWLNSGSTHTGVNLFTDCADFAAERNTYGILTGSSTYYGVAVTQTPTPTPTPTSTPQIPSAMRGSLIITYDEANAGVNTPYVTAIVNGVERQLTHSSIDYLYSTYLYNGDVVTIRITTTSANNTIDVTRRDYQTDSIGGDLGITDTFITGTTGAAVGGYYDLTFTATTSPLDYNFEYYVNTITSFPVTPTVTPTNTVTPTPTRQPTITNAFVAAFVDTFKYSYDGINWSTSSNGNSIMKYPYVGYCDANVYMIAGLDSSSVQKIMYSYDGNYWYNTTINWSFNKPMAQFFGMSSNGSVWVAGGITQHPEQRSALLYSTNKTIWNVLPISFDMDAAGHIPSNIVWDGNKFVVSVQYVSNVYYISYDGINWIKYNTGATNIQMNTQNSFIYNGTNYVSNSSLTLKQYYSPNLTDWYLSTGDASDYSNAQLLAGTKIFYGMQDNGTGSRNFLCLTSSDNGQSFSDVPSLNNIYQPSTSYYGQINSMAYNGSLYVANGQGGTGGGYNIIGMSTSSDGISWTKGNTSSEFLSNVLLSNPNSYTSIIGPTPTMTPTVTPTNTVTPTITPTNSVTPTVTPTNTVTPTVTPTNTVTPTVTVTPTKTTTPTPTVTPTNTVTPTITPTVTPTVTPTPNWPTIQYRVISNKANATGTFTYSNLKATIDSTVYNFSDMTFTSNGGTQTSTAQPITDLNYIGVSVSPAIRRDLCKSTGTHTRDTSYGRIYINGTQVSGTGTITTNTSIPTCPTQLSNSFNSGTLGTITINPGDQVVYEWTDDTI